MLLFCRTVPQADAELKRLRHTYLTIDKNSRDRYKVGDDSHYKTCADSRTVRLIVSLMSEKYVPAKHRERWIGDISSQMDAIHPDSSDDPSDSGMETDSSLDKQSSDTHPVDASSCDTNDDPEDTDQPRVSAEMQRVILKELAERNRLQSADLEKRIGDLNLFIAARRIQAIARGYIMRQRMYDFRRAMLFHADCRKRMREAQAQERTVFKVARFCAKRVCPAWNGSMPCFAHNKGRPNAT